jgi:hypothetical protein
MSAVVEAVSDIGDAIGDVAGGIVEAAGDVVESVGEVVSDVGESIDTYVIQPIMDDPLTAIASVAAAYYLGPMAASYFGTSAAVGTGLAVAAGNTAAGLAQGESFDEAIKGGAMAGLTAGVTQGVFGPGEGAMGPPAPAGLGENFVGPPMESGSYFTGPVEATPIISPSEMPAFDFPVSDVAQSPLQTVSDVSSLPSDVAQSPLQTASDIPAADFSVPKIDLLSDVKPNNMGIEGVNSTPSNLPADYSIPKIDLLSDVKPNNMGIEVGAFTPSNSFDIYGEPSYNLFGAPGSTSGPGLQIPDSPNISSMGGGQGLTADVSGLPQYMENGVPTTFTGASGNTYGNPTPDGTISATGFTPGQPTFTYGSENMGEMGTFDKLMDGDFTGTAKDIGMEAWNYAKANPLTAIGGILAVDQLLDPAKPPEPPRPAGGSTRDKSFDKGLDLYAYLRDRQQYQGDLTRYGQAGQGGEQNFFANERFVPMPIAAKMGGLIQMKHFAQGGQMQDPRRAQMMQAMAQQRPAGMGGPQGGRAMPPQGMPPQQGQRPPMPQRPRDPKMAYYQYGNPPQARAMGGLSQVRSMKIGGGADGRSDDVNAVLSDGEYVMDAETVAMLGNGSSKAGAARLDQMRANLRKQKGQALSQGQISPDAKSPLSYLKGA